MLLEDLYGNSSVGTEQFGEDLRSTDELYALELFRAYPLLSGPGT